MEKRFISRAEARRQLGISLPTLEKRLDDGSIPFVRLGRRVLIPAEAIENLVRDALAAGGAR